MATIVFVYGQKAFVTFLDHDQARRLAFELGYAREMSFGNVA